MHIVFFGPEGSGKGTQAKLLADLLKLPVLTSGDLVRDAAARDTGPLGDVCRAALREGGYVADEDMFVLWGLKLGHRDGRKGWIMDGFPRTLPQAKFLAEKVEELGYALDKVIFLRISPEESEQRLLKRARPLHPGSRELHDSPQRISARLATYRFHEKEVVAFYRSLGILVEIDGQQSPDAVHADIVAKLS